MNNYRQSINKTIRVLTRLLPVLVRCPCWVRKVLRLVTRHPVQRKSTNMSLANSIYQTLFRRTSTFAITVMVGAVFFERMFDQGGDMIFEQMNRGVRVLFCLLTQVLT